MKNGDKYLVAWSRLSQCLYVFQCYLISRFKICGAVTFESLSKQPVKKGGPDADPEPVKEFRFACNKLGPLCRFSYVKVNTSIANHVSLDSH